MATLEGSVAEQLQPFVEDPEQQGEEQKEHTQQNVSDLNENQVQDLQAAVKKQMEFYFGNANYFRDKILKDEANKHPEKFVNAEFLLKFNRLRALTTDKDFIRQSLQDSDIVEMGNSDIEFARKRTFVSGETRVNDYGPRTVVFIGFDETLVFDIDSALTFFTNQFGKVELVKVLTFPQRKFNGSIIVQFSTLEDATKAINTDPSIVNFNGSSPKEIKPIKDWKKTRKGDSDKNENNKRSQKRKREGQYDGSKKKTYRKKGHFNRRNNNEEDNAKNSDENNFANSNDNSGNINNNDDENNNNNNNNDDDNCNNNNNDDDNNCNNNNNNNENEEN